MPAIKNRTDIDCGQVSCRQNSLIPWAHVRFTQKFWYHAIMWAMPYKMDISTLQQRFGLVGHNGNFSQFHTVRGPLVTQQYHKGASGSQAASWGRLSWTGSTVRGPRLAWQYCEGGCGEFDSTGIGEPQVAWRYCESASYVCQVALLSYASMH